ncbi:MAG: LysR family transcriptional regulator [Proteobacteria bacterium]|nr:LysR family transcriptional regulator [Pseudomonadota bacterium]
MFPSTLRRLEVFIAVVDAGSFAAAAERLGISQPSISGHVAALEQQMQQKLFNRRRGTSPALTEQGRRLYERGTELLGQVERMTQELGLDQKRVRSKRLVISVQRFLANYVLSHPLVDFAKEHPNIEMVIDIGTYEDVMADLLEGHADIGFFLSRAAVADMPSELVGVQALGFYAAPGHSLAGREDIAPAEIAAEAFVGAHKGSRFGQMIDEILGFAGIANYPVAYQAKEAAIIAELVKVGLGISCSLALSVAHEVQSGKLIRLPVSVPTLQVEVRQALSPRHHPSQSTLLFANYLKTKNVFA